MQRAVLCPSAAMSHPMPLVLSGREKKGRRCGFEGATGERESFKKAPDPTLSGWRSAGVQERNRRRGGFERRERERESR
eukprot:361692-Chlamydomonas_euryale.AAC.3